MKNTIILLVASLFLSVPAFSQKTTPDIVKKEFAKKYPAAQSVKWSSEEANEWEAEFTDNGKEMSSGFDNNGVWLETEVEITGKELPEAVLNTLKNEFTGYKKGEMSIIEDPKMNGYEIELKKGEETISIVIDNSGKVIKKSEVKKEKEEKKKD
jgi:hypothetical protein